MRERPVWYRILNALLPVLTAWALCTFVLTPHLFHGKPVPPDYSYITNVICLGLGGIFFFGEILCIGLDKRSKKGK